MSKCHQINNSGAEVTFCEDVLDPQVQRAKEAYDTAGLRRNVCEEQYRQAREKFGALSDEAKKAKAALMEAQADLEQKQAAYRALVNKQRKVTHKISKRSPAQTVYDREPRTEDQLRALLGGVLPSGERTKL